MYRKEGTESHRDEALKLGPHEQYQFLAVQVGTRIKKKANNSIQPFFFSPLWK